MAKSHVPYQTQAKRVLHDEKLHAHGEPTLLQKAFVVSVGNTFMISVRGTDTICTIQKINHLLYRLERTDTKNHFSKRKTSFYRRPDPRRGSGGGRRRPCPDLAEGGGGAQPRGRRGGEGGRR
jgi:hypothetical protein